MILSLLKKLFKSDHSGPKLDSLSVGQKVRPLDRTSLSISDNTIVERFTTMLSPEQVLYSLKVFLLKILLIIFESSITGLCKLAIVGRLMSVIKGISKVDTVGTIGTIDTIGTIGITVLAIFKGFLDNSTPLFFDVNIGNSFEAVGSGILSISAFSTF